MLKPSDLFHTPKDWNEIQSWIERHAPEERIHLYTAAFMAWNLAAKLTSEPNDANAPDQSSQDPQAVPVGNP